MPYSTVALNEMKHLDYDWWLARYAQDVQFGRWALKVIAARLWQPTAIAETSQYNFLPMEIFDRINKWFVLIRIWSQHRKAFRAFDASITNLCASEDELNLVFSRAADDLTACDRYLRLYARYVKECVCGKFGNEGRMFWRYFPRVNVGDYERHAQDLRKRSVTLGLKFPEFTEINGTQVEIIY